MNTKIVVSRKSIVLLTAFAVMLLVSCIFNVFNSITNIAVLSVVLMCVTLEILKNSNGTYLSFATFFVIFSFIIHMGHPFLITLGFDTVLGYDQRGYTTEDVYLLAIQYCVITHVCLYLGMILGAYKKQSEVIPFEPIKKSKALNLAELQRTYSVGLILFMICLLPRLYVDGTKFVLFLLGGYLNTYSAQINGYILTLAKMMDIAVILLVVGSQLKRQRARAWFLFMIGYHGIYMLTGNRGEAVIRIIILWFVYSRLFSPPKLSFAKKLGVFALVWIGSAILETIGSLRVTGFSIGEFVSLLIDNAIYEPAVLKVFSEFGVSIITVCYSIETFPILQSFSYGVNYLKGLLVVLPNLGGFVANIIRESVFVYYFPVHRTLGGSYIGEMFYAFGQFGSLLALPIGFFISKLDTIRIKAYSQQNWNAFVATIVFIVPMMWWIRDYYYNMVREIILTNLVILLLFEVTKPKKTRKI